MSKFGSDFDTCYAYVEIIDMSFSRTTPHDGLPPLPPGAQLETVEVMQACISASRCLAELKGRLALLPDPTLLINTIPLQEARSSSEIENIVTTQDALYLASMNPDDETDAQTKEVLRYRSALRLAFEQVTERGLSLNLVREICSVLMDRSMSVRESHEHVHLGSAESGAIVYTPPTGGPVLSDKLENFLYFVRGEGPAATLDPLVRMAVGHYQFEAIHPFLDGNGRTGRILNLTMLVHDGLLALPVLYLSRFILEHKTEYYQRLRAVTEEGAWSEWVIFMLRGVQETASWTLQRLTHIDDLLAATVVRCRNELPKRVYSKELIEILFRQPYCKTAFVVEAGIAKRQTAAEYLRELEKIGVLKSEKHGRELIYKHPALIDVFAA